MALQFSDNGLETSTLRELFQELSDGYKGIYGQDIDLDQGISRRSTRGNRSSGSGRY